MSDILFSLPAFVFVLGVIIFVHEAGHLFVAKAFGMRVFIFSFGFGKRLFGFQWGDTDCRVSLVPLGGYVKLEGEPEDHLSEDTSQRAVGDGKDFLSRPRWQRFVVYLAGPAMNVVLTMVVLTIFYMIGFMVDASRYDRPILGAVEAGSPAAAAGLLPGDSIVAIDGRPVKNWEEVQYEVLPRPDRDIAFKVRRGATERDVTVRPLAKGQDKVGDIGAHPLVRISAVVEGSPAERAGFRPDDAILRIGDTPVKSFEEIPPLVQGSKGEELAVLVWRDGQTLALTVSARARRRASIASGWAPSSSCSASRCRGPCARPRPGAGTPPSRPWACSRAWPRAGSRPRRPSWARWASPGSRGSAPARASVRSSPSSRC